MKSKTLPTKKYLPMTSIVSKNKEEFRSLRSRGIGASEVASVIGVNPYQTPYELWQVKTGKVAQFEGNKYTRMGHYLEPVIVKLFLEEVNAEIEEGNELDITIFHKEHDYIFCTPDRPYVRDGKKGALECKSTQRKVLEDELSLSWQAQNQYQIGICGFDEGCIAWLERGLDFGYKFTEFNPVLFDALVNEVGEFWHNYVLSDTPPPAINSSDIQKLYSTIPGKHEIATSETYDAYLKLKHVREQLKNLITEKEQLEEQMKMIMKDAESIIYNDETLVTWKEQTSNRLNQSAFKREQKALFDYYCQPSKSRTFRVK